MQRNEKVFQDLEFPEILALIAQNAQSEKVAEQILQAIPIEDIEEIKNRLDACREFQGGQMQSNSIPFGDFFTYDEELKHIEIENYSLPTDVFLQIRTNALLIKDILKHLETFVEYFPTIAKNLEKTTFQKELVSLINEVFNKHGELKDTASDALYQIRRSISLLEEKGRKTFEGSLKQNRAFLEDIRESLLNNTRVLAVKAMYKKRVKGRFLGQSKTGSIVFIEPDSMVNINRELEETREEEKKEIYRILIQLTAQIKVYKPNLLAYQKALYFLDYTQAQAKFASHIQASYPTIENKPALQLKQAYHPLLWISNEKKKLKTIPQDIILDHQQRLMVISGPNAGGKSITLKTIGLLQLMIQTGIPVPIHPKSKMGIFHKIFTDIGDGQSIENQLSTYSYRLKQMQHFIYHANENSLILIDEFGTGSDPELGGALAEVFFEDFYEKKSFGVFTTHYSNIKILAEQLQDATNACMLFDKKTLSPLYQLEVGQPGSSFTFEVAEKNKIPYRLINRAKKKVEGEMVRLDKTILKLQQEKHDVQKTKNEIAHLKDERIKEQEKLLIQQEKLQKKLLDFKILYEDEQQHLNWGKKLAQWIEAYKKHRKKKKIIDELLKFTEKILAEKPAQLSKPKKNIRKSLENDLKETQPQLEEKHHQQKEEKKQEKLQKSVAIKVGDRVRIKDGMSVGTVEEIKNQTLTINYGAFITKISIFEVQKI